MALVKDGASFGSRQLDKEIPVLNPQITRAEETEVMKTRNLYLTIFATLFALVAIAVLSVTLVGSSLASDKIQNAQGAEDTLIDASHTAISQVTCNGVLATIVGTEGADLTERRHESYRALLDVSVIIERACFRSLTQPG